MLRSSRDSAASLSSRAASAAGEIGEGGVTGEGAPSSRHSAHPQTPNASATTETMEEATMMRHFLRRACRASTARRSAQVRPDSCMARAYSSCACSTASINSG